MKWQTPLATRPELQPTEPEPALPPRPASMVKTCTILAILGIAFGLLVFWYTR